MLRPRTLIFIALTFLLFGSAKLNAQMVTIDPHTVVRSPLIDRLLAIKRAEPNISLQRFAQMADEELHKVGIDFQFSLDRATCEKILAEKTKQKDPNAPVRLTGKLMSIGGDGTSLAFPEPSFQPSECGGCYITLPVLEARSSDFVAVVRERNIRFELPSNFFVERMFLVDKDDLNSVKQEWRIPQRMEPIGVTHDETVVYLTFLEPELADLSLLVYDTGNFRIGTRADAEEGGIGKILKPKDTTAAVFSYTQFDRWGNNYVLAWRPPCQHQTRR